MRLLNIDRPSFLQRHVPGRGRRDVDQVCQTSARPSLPPRHSMGQEVELDAELRNELYVEIKKLHETLGNTMIYRPMMRSRP